MTKNQQHKNFDLKKELTQSLQNLDQYDPVFEPIVIQSIPNKKRAKTKPKYNKTFQLRQEFLKKKQQNFVQLSKHEWNDRTHQGDLFDKKIKKNEIFRTKNSLESQQKSKLQNKELIKDVMGQINKVDKITLRNLIEALQLGKDLNEQEIGQIQDHFKGQTVKIKKQTQKMQQKKTTKKPKKKLIYYANKYKNTGVNKKQIVEEIQEQEEIQKVEAPKEQHQQELTNQNKVQQFESIEKQLEKIQDMMSPMIQEANKNLQSSKESMSLIQKSIGKSIKVNCEKVIELLIDELLVEQVHMLNNIEAMQEKNLQQERINQVLGQFLHTINKYEQQLNDRQLEVNKNQIVQQQIIKKKMTVKMNKPLFNIQEEKNETELEIDNNLVEIINVDKEYLQREIRKNNHNSLDFVKATKQAQQKILDELFEDVYNEMMSVQMNYLTELVKNEIN